MAPFRLDISEHAAHRLKERGITREVIRRCISAGERTSLDVNGRLVKQLLFKDKILTVVYLELKGGALVITAYWKD
jgi:Domain of unknown function (DUF4258)